MPASVPQPSVVNAYIGPVAPDPVYAIPSSGPPGGNAGEVKTQLVGTATAAFDTLGEIETQVLAVDANVNALEQQVSTLSTGSSYVLFFENALI